MAFNSQIPQISISLAPPEEIPAEPFSPFKNTSFNLSNDEEGFRAVHLTPPPMNSKFIRNRHQSPTGPKRITGLGLDKDRFQALLNASREIPAKKQKPATDLRKEVALKAHRTKQAERRALFLSKVLQPPSPTAAVTPVTPPDSPAIFHYSLPSPGLVSPISHYESLHDDESNDTKPWVEQVDFKLLTPRTRPPRLSLGKPKQPLPSLEQISARLNFHRAARAQEALDEHAEMMNIQLPTPVSAPEHLVVGRLKMPLRSVSKPLSTAPAPPRIVFSPPRVNKPATLTVPHVVVDTPTTDLSRMGLIGGNSRESRSSTMLNTLRRRTQSNVRVNSEPAASDDGRSMRRRSAPAGSLRERAGFGHPILALPGAF